METDINGEWITITADEFADLVMNGYGSLRIRRRKEKVDEILKLPDQDDIELD